MTTTVTMLQTRLGENGSLWTIGNSYAASDAFAAVLISSNLATGTLPKSRGLVPLWGQTDNTGAVASLVDGGGIANVNSFASAAIRRSTNGLHKIIGGTVNTGRTTIVTQSIKQEVEADYYASKIVIISHESAASTGYKAVVGSTDTANIASHNPQYQPTVSGNQYNALRGSTDDYGWNAVTWGGAATADISSGASISAPKFIESDWILNPSVPRAAGEASSRPLHLMRVYKNGATDTSSYYSGMNSVALRSPSAENRGRIFDLGAVIGSDGIGNLGATFADSTTSMPIVLALRYSRPVVTVAAVGDSQTQGISTSGDAVSSWLVRACYDLSTPTLPVIPQNMGYSSQTSITYLAAAKVLLPILKPNICFYMPFSSNDLATPTARSVNDGMARAADFIDLCAQNNIYPILWTSLPNDAYALATDNIRKVVSVKVRELATARGVGFADWDALLSDGASPARWIPAYKYDNTHFNNAGHEAIATLVAKQAIQRAL